MKTSSSTSAQTEDQEKNYRRLVEDAAKRAVDLALSEVVADKAGWDRLLAKGNELGKVIVEAIISKTRELSFVYGEQLAKWSAFYKKHFNLTPDLSGVEITDHQDGFDRLIIIARGLTRNQVYDACEKQFPCWRYREDLDGSIKTDERDPKNGTYAIWVRDRQEADEENKNQSYDQRRKQECQDETILEHMLHKLKYFDETGKHLDINNWTLTSSLDSGGGAVGARWPCGRFNVRCWRVGDHNDYLRARSAVSCQPKPERA